MKYALSGRRGSLMLVTLMLMVALSVFVTTFMFSVLSASRVTSGQEDSKKSFYLAEAGLQKAIWYLCNTAPDGSLYGTWRTKPYPAAAGLGLNDPRHEFLDGVIYSYTLWVQDFTAAPDFSIDPQVYITASATVNSLTRTLHQRVRMEVGPSVSIVPDSWGEE